ncbi:MAG: hypothetical protein ACRCXT_00675 [Paraclostridium sp.]
MDKIKGKIDSKVILVATGEPVQGPKGDKGDKGDNYGISSKMLRRILYII